MKDKHTKPNLQSRRKYSKEFKDELVRRLLDGESGTELSQHFGVSSSLLYRWKVDYLHRMGSSDEDVRSPAALEAEIRRLRHDLKKVEQEREILKKALTIFGR